MTYLNGTQILMILLLKMIYANMENDNSYEKNSFTKLLKNIVDVNEKRVLAMKKLSDLQDFIYTRNSLAKIHDFEFEEDSAEDSIVAMRGYKQNRHVNPEIMRRIEHF